MTQISFKSTVFNLQQQQQQFLLVNIAKQEDTRQMKTECILYLSYVTGKLQRDNYVFVSKQLPKKQQHM